VKVPIAKKSVDTAILIISDLHVGAGPLDDCDDELEAQLVSFIEGVCTRAYPVELIINGDFLDFAQAPPWRGRELESVSALGIPLCFTEEQSVAKLRAIVKEHISIFAGLTNFLAANSQNRLVINPGNHDADFFWPRVRAVFLKSVLGKGRADPEQVLFNLAQVYKPDFGNTWIEHGNNYDPANQFRIDEYDPIGGSHLGRSLYWDQAKPPILTDRTGVKRLYECLGTRFMIEFLNSLDAHYPFVDNVKPFKRFLQIFGASAFVSGFGPLKATLAVWRMLRYISGNAVTDPTGLLETERTEKDPAAVLLVEKIKMLSDEERFAFHQTLRDRQFNLERSALTYLQDPEMSVPLLTFLSENLDLLDAFPQDNSSYLSQENSAPDGYLTLSKRFAVDETQELIRAAQSIIRENKVEAVIMGHTHEPVRDPELAYFNTGSWTRNYDFKDRKLTSWEILKPGSQKYFPYELNYVELSDPAEPRMETYAREEIN